MLKMMCRFNGNIAFMFAMLLILTPLAASAAERISIKADPCGPMAALANAHKSVRLVSKLEHKDGSPLLASEVRTAPDSTFYLPSDAKPDSEAFAKFLADEREAFPAPLKKACPEKKTEASAPPPTISRMSFTLDLPQQLTVGQSLTLNPFARMSDGSRQVVPFVASSTDPNILGVSIKDGVVTVTAKKAGSAIISIAPADSDGKPITDKATKQTFAVQDSPDAGISWWWLWLPLALAALLGFLWLRARNDRENLRVDHDALQARLNAVPPDVATAQQERDEARRDQARAEERLRLANAEIDRMVAQWGNLDDVRARLDGLENPVPLNPTTRIAPRRP